MPFYFKLIIVALLILVGLFFKFKRPDKNNFKGKFMKNENPILASNYIGNFILFNAFTVLFYFTWSYKNPAVYLLGVGMTFAALVFHIRDVTGKPINEIFNKIKFSEENLRMNTFMRITFSLMIVFFIAFLVTVVLFRK